MVRSAKRKAASNHWINRGAYYGAHLRQETGGRKPIEPRGVMSALSSEPRGEGTQGKPAN